MYIETGMVRYIIAIFLHNYKQYIKPTSIHNVKCGETDFFV